MPFEHPTRRISKHLIFFPATQIPATKLDLVMIIRTICSKPPLLSYSIIGRFATISLIIQFLRPTAAGESNHRMGPISLVEDLARIVILVIFALVRISLSVELRSQKSMMK